jgi:glycosyltransferase involved in cell wall biosynthesis
MTPLVTIGVPVYRGEDHLAEAIESIRGQTVDDWRVIISIDGPDPGSEGSCERYRDDPRIEVSVRPQRLGWARNIDWLQQQAEGEFWYYHQQDDIVSPRYLEILIGAARDQPDAAVVYSDIDTFGTRETRFTQPSVVGSPVERQLAFLEGHFAGVAFRGLTRIAAMHDTGGGIVPNDRDDFAVDVVWMAVMATWGDLVRVPEVLYRKRYHAGNSHGEWLSWDRPTRRKAWTAHCHDLLAVAMGVPSSESQRWELWQATVMRLTASKATSYLPWSEMTDMERAGMVDDLLVRVTDLGRVDLASLLGRGLDEIRGRSLQLVAGAA